LYYFLYIIVYPMLHDYEPTTTKNLASRNYTSIALHETHFDLLSV